jgi:hypothetical protein
MNTSLWPAFLDDVRGFRDNYRYPAATKPLSAGTAFPLHDNKELRRDKLLGMTATEFDGFFVPLSRG